MDSVAQAHTKAQFLLRDLRQNLADAKRIADFYGEEPPHYITMMHYRAAAIDVVQIKALLRRAVRATEKLLDRPHRRYPLI